MIRFGPAGIPLSCKGRTIRDGIEDIHALGLHCMEIQLVRGKYWWLEGSPTWFPAFKNLFRK